MTTQIPYRSEGDRVLQTTTANIPHGWTLGQYTILANDTAEVLPNVGNILMVRLFGDSANTNTVYVGPANVTSALFADKFAANQFTDVNINRLEKIYVFGKLGDKVNYTYFTGAN